MLQNGIKITAVCVCGNNFAQIYYSHYSKAILKSSGSLLPRGSGKRHKIYLVRKKKNYTLCNRQCNYKPHSAQNLIYNLLWFLFHADLCNCFVS